MDLKEQTTRSFAWNFMDKIGYQLIALIVGIFTLRLLSPTDFGYTGALAVFTMLSNILVESGFTAALVRRRHNSDRDYTAAFLFNLALSVVLYLLLFFSAGLIARYYHMAPLTALARVIFLAIIINSFTIVQTIILTKELKFKQMTIANLGGMMVSAVITLWMAATGWGYWALAAQQISQVLVKAVILWCLSHWRPARIRWADFRVIGEIFSFSALLILSSAISTVVKYVYTLFIGPRYSTEQVGYYSQAFKYHQIPQTVISGSIAGVAYPVLSSLIDRPEQQMQYMHRIVKMTAFITFPVMVGFAAISENFVHVIITDKWLPMLPYLRLLLVGGACLPFISVMQNMLNVFGKPNLNFATELGRNILIIALLLMFNRTIEQILYGYIIASVTALVGTAVVTSRVTGYRLRDMVAHTAPSLALSVVMGLAAWWLPEQLPAPCWLRLIAQLALGGTVYLGLAALFRMDMIETIIDTLKTRHNNAHH